MKYNCYDQGFKTGEIRYETAERSAIGISHWQGASHNKLLSEEQRIKEILRSGPNRLRTKCVFISHRQSDAKEALSFAQYLKKNNISYWLDIHDPILTTGGPLSPFAIANIIEIALINSTHVVAIVTDNSKGSEWIPYEYGRIKDPISYSGNVCAYDQLISNKLPDYMKLSAVEKDNLSVLNWIKTTPI